MFKSQILYRSQILLQRIITFVGGIILPMVPQAQNLVPNPSFEDTSACILSTHPEIACSVVWSESTVNNPALNTPDLCFNGAVFFPPSSIPAIDGTKYIGLDCQPMNSEYVQAPLIQSLQAGKSYCVSFYVSVCDQTMNPAISLGAYFSVGEMTSNPFTMGLAAHVQGAVPFDPTIWTKISGVYTASGGESHIVLGGFENAGQPGFVYMYIDLVEVYEIPDQNHFYSREICEDSTVQLTANVAPSVNNILWSTNETAVTISVNQPGLFTLEKTYGSCVLTDTFLVELGNCSIDTSSTDTTEVVEEIQTLFIPSAFTPNGDGTNDVFKVYGEGLTELQVNIFNRWGEIIFSADELNFSWDGTNKGIPVKQDVYVYQLYFENSRGITEARRGKLVLLR